MSDRPLRLAVLLSGTGRTLENLIEKSSKDNLGFEFASVLSSRAGVRGLEIAQAAGIPTAVVQRRDFDSVQSFSNAITRSLPLESVDLVIMAGFLQLYLLPESLQNRVINIHPSLLPLFGGKGYFGHHVHEAVLESGMRVSGCTVHFVDNEYDSGPILAQSSCPVLPDDDADSLAARVFDLECELLPRALSMMKKGAVSVRDGSAIIDSSAL